jgi:endonuclease/exonuclease/phosphatase family metal-dependent hydrolase
LRAERASQGKELLGPQWLRHPDATGPRILCGDFNARPESGVHRALSKELRDVQAGHEVWAPRSTFFGRLPMFRIDHIFVDHDVEVTEVQVPSTRLTRAASDHLPLIADLVLPVRGNGRPIADELAEAGQVSVELSGE